MNACSTLDRNALRWIAAASLILLAMGCSNMADPGDGATGSITLSLALDTPAHPQGSALMLAPPMDSVMVSIFRPNGGGLEVRKGLAVNGIGGNTVTLSCVAENNKTVSVDLFSGGVMWYHGANRNVDVPKNKSTNVNVDAFPFVVNSMTISPSVVVNGENFQMAWNSAEAATFYTLQESHTPDFETVIWAAVMPDTTAILVRGPGAHYFRVAPATPFTTGTFAPAELGYVLGGGQTTTLTGFDVLEVIPGDEFSIHGENLDMPGSEVWIGPAQAEIVYATWSEIRARVPLQAQSNYVFVYSPLDGGATYWGAPLQIQRIAYVSTTGLFFDHYKEFIEFYPDVLGFSTVAQVPASELDARDMSVFDLIVIAHDMGTNASDWGGGVPRRADAILDSGANILAVGLGGAIYLATQTAPAAGFALSGQFPEMLHVPDETQSVFSQPTKIVLTPSNDLLFSNQGPVSVITFDILPTQKPLSMRLLAESTRDSGQWTMLDFPTVYQATPVRNFYWGLADDPYTLTGQGAECFSNIVNELYNGAGVVIPATTRR